MNPSFENMAHGKTDIIRWRSTDGLVIEGLLTYPINYRKGKKVPLVLNIHGVLRVFSLKAIQEEVQYTQYRHLLKRAMQSYVLTLGDQAGIQRNSDLQIDRIGVEKIMMI